MEAVVLASMVPLQVQADSEQGSQLGQHVNSQAVGLGSQLVGLGSQAGAEGIQYVLGVLK